MLQIHAKMLLRRLWVPILWLGISSSLGAITGALGNVLNQGNPPAWLCGLLSGLLVGAAAAWIGWQKVGRPAGVLERWLQSIDEEPEPKSWAFSIDWPLNGVGRELERLTDQWRQEKRRRQETQNELDALRSHLDRQGRQWREQLETASTTVRSCFQIAEEVQALQLNLNRRLSDSARAEGSTVVVRQLQERISTLSESMGQLRGGLQTVTAALEDSGETINRMLSMVQELHTICSSFQENIRDGKDKANRNAARCHDLSEHVRGLKKLIDTMVKGHEKETKLLEIIDSVVKQTELLSINASIEAARAGSAGAGFGIVAEEIRKLSETTENSAKSIVDIIRRNQEAANEAQRLVNKVKAGAEEIEENATRVQSVFENISGKNVRAAGLLEETSRLLFEQEQRIAGLQPTLADMQREWEFDAVTEVAEMVRRLAQLEAQHQKDLESWRDLVTTSSQGLGDLLWQLDRLHGTHEEAVEITHSNRDATDEFPASNENSRSIDSPEAHLAATKAQ